MFLGRDADTGIDNRNSDHRVGLNGRLDPDFAAVGCEFHGVAQQIVKNLLKANAIRVQGDSAGRTPLDGDRLRSCQRSDTGQRLVHRRGHLERLRVQLEASRLDLA